MRSRFLEAVTGPRAPYTTHYSLLAVGFIVYVVAASRLWLFFDDWALLVSTPDLMWRAHVGHWTTVPYLIFVAIQHTFGMDGFIPFAIPVILAHLGLVHLVWRLSIRAGSRIWVATAISALLVFLGAGAENLDWAFQVGFVGAMTGMFAVILVVDRAPLTPVGAIGASVITLASLASSGTALPLLAVAVAVCIRRSGVLRTAAVFVVPVAAYVVWYWFHARGQEQAGRAQGTGGLLQVPQYAATMLGDGLGRMFPFVVLGSAAFAALALWWILRIGRSSGSAWTVALVFLAAPVFALLTGYSRISLGLDTATSGRYVYFVVFCLAPLSALALSRAALRVSTAPVIAVIVVLVLWNLGGVALELHDRKERTDATRSHLSAAAALIAADPGAYPSDGRPYPPVAPDITVGDLKRWVAEGWFRPSSYTAANTYSELTILGLDVSGSEAPSSRTGCERLEAGDPRAHFDGAALVYSDHGSSASVTIGDGAVEGDPSTARVRAGWSRVDLRSRSDVQVGIAATDVELVACPAD